MKFELKAWHIYVLQALSLVWFLLVIFIGNLLLNSVSPADMAVIELHRMADTAFYISWGSTILFTLLANLFYWQNGQHRFFWLTLLYFSITNIAYYWLLEECFLFKKANGLWRGEFSLTYIGAVFFIILWATALVINYAVIRHLRKRKAQTA